MVTGGGGGGQSAVPWPFQSASAPTPPFENYDAGTSPATLRKRARSSIPNIPSAHHVGSVGLSPSTPPSHGSHFSSVSMPPHDIHPPSYLPRSSVPRHRCSHNAYLSEDFVPWVSPVTSAAKDAVFGTLGTFAPPNSFDPLDPFRTGGPQNYGDANEQSSSILGDDDDLQYDNPYYRMPGPMHVHSHDDLKAALAKGDGAISVYSHQWASRSSEEAQEYVSLPHHRTSSYRRSHTEEGPNLAKQKQTDSTPSHTPTPSVSLYSTPKSDNSQAQLTSSGLDPLDEFDDVSTPLEEDRPLAVPAGLYHGPGEANVRSPIISSNTQDTYFDFQERKQSPTSYMIRVPKRQQSPSLDHVSTTDNVTKVKIVPRPTGLSIETSVTNMADLSNLLQQLSIGTAADKSPHVPHSGSLEEWDAFADNLSRQHIRRESDATTFSDAGTTSSERSLISKNRAYHYKPVNRAGRVYYIGSGTVQPQSVPLSPLSSSGDQLNSRALLNHLVQTCAHVYCSCFPRYPPILDPSRLHQWLFNLDSPTDHLYVNAICLHVFKHSMVHHASRTIKKQKFDLKQIHYMEEWFFQNARRCLAEQLLDEQDEDGDDDAKHLDSSYDGKRCDVVAMLMLAAQTRTENKGIFLDMAVRTLYSINIRPRLAKEDDDVQRARLYQQVPLTPGQAIPSLTASDEEEERDTRLWWYMWSYDFWLFASGVTTKNVTCPVNGTVDMPRALPKERGTHYESAVLGWEAALRIWRIQSDISWDLYLSQTETISLDRLTEYEERVMAFVSEDVPAGLRVSGGYKRGHAQQSDDHYKTGLNIQMEVNATWLILHKLFLPDPDESSLELSSDLELNNEDTRAAMERSLQICREACIENIHISEILLGFHPCSFDNDEVWRAGEILDIIMSDAAGVRAGVGETILKDGRWQATQPYLDPIDPSTPRMRINSDMVDDLVPQAIAKCAYLLHSTREYQYGSPNFLKSSAFAEGLCGKWGIDAESHWLFGSLDHQAGKRREGVQPVTVPHQFKIGYAIRTEEVDAMPPRKPQGGQALETSSASSSMGMRPKVQRSTSDIIDLLPKGTKKQMALDLAYTTNVFSATKTEPMPGTPTHGSIQHAHIMDPQGGFNSQSPPSVPANASPTDQGFSHFQPNQLRSRTGSSGGVRFRYFNPRKENKYLFIDENASDYW